MTTQWTPEQVHEWAKGQQWRFSSYYKYEFFYTATDESGCYIGSLCTGGDSGDIYRYDVCDDEVNLDRAVGGMNHQIYVRTSADRVLGIYQSEES